MKKAVIYSCHLEGRISEPDNEMQIAICMEYARQHDIEIVGNYEDCVETKQQPLFMRKFLLEDCKRNRWDMVLFSSMTILGRKLNSVLRFIMEIRKYAECTFVDQENNEMLKQIGFILDFLHKEKRL